MRKNLGRVLAVCMATTMAFATPVLAKETTASAETVEATEEAETETLEEASEVEEASEQDAENETEVEAETEAETETEVVVEEDGATEKASAGISVLLSEYCAKNKNSKKKILKQLATAEETAEEDTPEEEVTTQHEQYFNNLGIAIVDSYVNVRSEASVESDIVGKIYGNDGMTIVKEDGDWYQIKSGSIKGYVNSNYVITGEEAEKYALEMGYVLAVVNADALNLRAGTSTDTEKVGSLVKGSTYVVLEISDNWAKLAVSETEQGWVSMDYISVEAVLETAVDITEDKPEDQVIVETTEEETEEATQATEKATEAVTQATEAATKATEKTTEKTTQAIEKTTEAAITTTQEATDKNGVSGSDIVAYAKQFLGNPYVYGGSSLTNGTDCSGFTMSVYAHFGYYINRTSSSQVSNGVAVSLSALQPGDLVFYAPSGTVNHVAIYIGNGQIIHASSPSTGIMISNLNYGSSPCYARRIIQ